MKKKTEFQKFCIELVTFILQNKAYQENLNWPEYKEVMNIILRRYSEYTESHEKIVDNLSRLMKYCRVTERAVELIENHQLSLLSNSKVKQQFSKDGLLYQEHLMPIGEALKQLNALSLHRNMTEVEFIMDKLELILITRQEQKVLDGSMSLSYKLDGKTETGRGMKSYVEPQKRLDSINAKIHKDFEQNGITNSKTAFLQTVKKERMTLSAPDFQQKFWNAFKAFSMPLKPFLFSDSERAQDKHHFDISLVSSSAKISLVVNTKENYISCEIYIPNSKALFHKYERNKAKIHNELGCELTWEELPDKKASRIWLKNYDVLIEDESRWKLIYFPWLLDKAEAFYVVFRKYN